MRKRILFIIATVSVLLATSCGKDDLELLRHSYRLQGEFDPSYAIPVAHGQVNLNELLAMFDGSFSAFITDDDVITFHYDTSISETIHIGDVVDTSFKHYQPTPKAKRSTKEYAAPFISRDTVIEYSLPIDLFDNADLREVVDAGIRINQLMLTLSAHVQGGCPPEVEYALKNYVYAKFDNVVIKYIPHGGNESDEKTFMGFAQQSLRLDNIIEGGSVSFDSVNLAEIVNALPSRITAGLHLHMEVDSAIVEDQLVQAISDTGSINTFNALLDSLKMTWLTFGAALSVDIPLEIHIGQLPMNYQMPLNMSAQQEDGNTVFDNIRLKLDQLFGDGAVNMDSSSVSLILKMENGIPLHIQMDGVLVDENNTPVLHLIQNGDIAAAQTATDAATGADTVVAPTISTIVIPITLEDAEKFLTAKSLNMTMTISTDGPATKRMSIRRSDRLGIKLFIKLDPDMDFDIPLF